MSKEIIVGLDAGTSLIKFVAFDKYGKYIDSASVENKVYYREGGKAEQNLEETWNKVIEAFNSTQEYHRHYLMLLKSLGFHSTNIKINHKKRYEGKSSYGFITLIKLAIDGIISNSDTLLRKTITLGFIYVLFALAYSFYALFTYFYQGSYPGFTSIIIILLSSTGIILSSLGIIGIYIGKIFIQVKTI